MIVGYLSVDQILSLHDEQLEAHGGATGIRDRDALAAAAARPGMTFDGADLYEDLAAKAAALMHSLALNHPFVDGNKRVAAHAALVFLLLNERELLVTSDELVDMTLGVAEGNVAIEALTIWFRQRLAPAE